MRQSNAEKRIRRLRSQYRTRIVVVGIIALALGVALGIFADQKLLNRKDASTVAVSAEVTPMVVVTPEPTAVPPTEAPATEVPATAAPATEAPATEVPATAAPTAEPPAVEVTVTAAPATEAPATQAPATAAPATEAPATEAPATQAPAQTGEVAEVQPKSAEEDDKESYTIDIEDPAATPAVEATPTLAPTAVPTAEPTPEPTPAPGPTTLAIVPFGESYTFDAQINSDGLARYKVEEGEPFETLTFTLTMKEYLLPSDYASRWGTKYKLKGTEAGAGFDLTLGDYTGTCTIIPQNILTVVLQSETGDTVNPGFQMTDAEINGQTNVDIRSNATKTFWKRYTFSNNGEPMEYLSVSACVNGAVQTVLFELESDVPPTPNPAELYTTLNRGDKSDAVTDLQTRLIELGYLSGSADGNFGEKTQTAVRNAQKDFGMEETGSATPEFQAKLFAEPEATEAPEAETEAETEEKTDEEKSEN